MHIEDLMEIFSQPTNKMNQSELHGLSRSILYDNIRRGKVLAVAVIALETCLAAVDITTSLLKVDNRFHFSLYLMMYIAMIAVNVLFLTVTQKIKDVSSISTASIGRKRNWLVAYIIFMMSWGGVISMMDQKLYGQITVFIVNMVACSLLFYLNNRHILAAYSLPCVIMLVGLPFFQHSSDVLIGHYINLVVLIVILLIVSRNNYLRYCSDYRSRQMLTLANKQLEQEIDRNKSVNLLLAEANRQLRDISLVDDLTGVPNRRSFRNFIDAIFAEPIPKDVLFTVLMIDIDFFKEYNDHYGHTEGDCVLSAIAGQVKALVRHQKDITARWGGEEFIYSALDMDGEEALISARTLQAKVQQLQILHQFSKASQYITVSIGISTIQLQDRSDISTCIEQADKAMYKAKAEGKNKIEVYQSSLG
jgi:diguanylate cyclase (GGDEF)-like protein